MIFLKKISHSVFDPSCIEYQGFRYQIFIIEIELDTVRNPETFLSDQAPNERGVKYKHPLVKKYIYGGKETHICDRSFHEVFIIPTLNFE